MNNSSQQPVNDTEKYCEVLAVNLNIVQKPTIFIIVFNYHNKELHDFDLLYTN